MCARCGAMLVITVSLFCTNVLHSTVVWYDRIWLVYEVGSPLNVVWLHLWVHRSVALWMHGPLLLLMLLYYGVAVATRTFKRCLRYIELDFIDLFCIYACTCVCVCVCIGSWGGWHIERLNAVQALVYCWNNVASPNDLFLIKIAFVDQCYSPYAHNNKFDCIAASNQIVAVAFS